jgi:serine phosphatase RsbU (regulator of sigma subunit)
VRCLSAAGGLLGDEDRLHLGLVSTPFGPGDRLVLCTDGALELTREDGRPIGTRTVSRLLAAQPGRSAGDLCLAMGAALNGIRGDRPQEDDITVIAIEGTADEVGSVA